MTFGKSLQNLGAITEKDLSVAAGSLLNSKFEVLDRSCSVARVNLESESTFFFDRKKIYRYIS